MSQSLKLLNASLEGDHSAIRIPNLPMREHSLAIDEDGGLKRSATVFGEKYRSYAREHYGNEKVSPIVYCKVKIYRLTNLDLIGMTVTVDFCLMLDWIDLSILGEGKYPDLETAHFSPYVRIHNAKDELVKPVDSAFNRLQENSRYQGHVKRTERYRCTLYITDLNLSKYPFDKHDLRIILKGDHVSLCSHNCKVISDERKPLALIDPTKQYEEVSTVSPRKDCQHSSSEVDDSHLTGWTMTGFTKRDELTKKTTGDILQIPMAVKRNPFGLVMILIVPLVICIILSLTSFVLSPQSLSERLQITVTMLLAAAAFHQQARGHVPPNLPYTTVLDKYMLGTLFILLLQAFVHVLIAFVASEGPENSNSSSSSSSNSATTLESLLSCRCPDGSQSCFSTTSSLSSSSSSSKHSKRTHRLSYFTALFLLVSCYHIHSKAGSWKNTWNSIVVTVWTFLTTAAKFASWLGAGVAVFCTMSLGCHTVTISEIKAFVSGIVPTVVNSTWAILQCMQGNCSGLTNPPLCSSEVLRLLEWVLNDENLLEFMIFAILFVHLVLWVEFIN